MTDKKITQFFNRRISMSYILPLMKQLGQPLTLILVPSSHRGSVVLKFRPIWLLLSLVLLIIVTISSLTVFSNNTKAQLVRASLTRELNSSRKKLVDIHTEVEGMVNLIDRFQNAISIFGTPENTKNDNNITGNLSQDITNITATVGVKNSDYLNDIERLKLLSSSINKSIQPLEISMNALASQQNLLKELPTRWPVKDYNQVNVSFLFGPNLDPINRSRWYLHRGLDIAGPPGTTLVAAGSGKVIEVDYNPRGYGNYVVIKHKYGIYTLYAHQQRVFVRVGDVVNQGDEIGLMGATGRVTGPHLHFEIRIGSQILDPIIYLRMSTNNKAKLNKSSRKRQNQHLIN